eukprot:Sspe_Gene.18443::Locus_6614_Transcript_1_1_Confidence_1.000_Length_1280::g.18443::m.18443
MSCPLAHVGMAVCEMTILPPLLLLRLLALDALRCCDRAATVVSPEAPRDGGSRDWFSEAGYLGWCSEAGCRVGNRAPTGDEHTECVCVLVPSSRSQEAQTPIPDNEVQRLL